MIKQFMKRSSRLEIMTVIDRYSSGGAPECDLLDFSGVLHTGVSIMSAGANTSLLMAVPEIGAEVVVLLSAGGAPYLLGALPDDLQFKDEIEITSAGEYPPIDIGLDHAQIKSAGARLVAGDEALYLSPRTRIQGHLAISAGGSPTQHLAIAEPVISDLEHHRALIAELQAAVRSLQAGIASLKDAAVLDLPTGIPTNLELIATPSDSLTTPSAISVTIASEIAEIER